MRKTKKKLNLDKETARALSKFALTRAVGGSDNSECYCPGFTDPNSCVAQCGIGQSRQNGEGERIPGGSLRARARDANARIAVGDREQDGVGVATVTRTGSRCPRTYLAPFAQAPVVIRRARPRRPSAQQPTASRACTRSPGATRSLPS